MKKSKGQTIDSFYTTKKETKRKTKNAKVAKGRPSKNKKTSSKKNEDNEVINLDNEIIIGLTPKNTEKKKKEPANKNKTKAKTRKNDTKKTKKTKSKSNVKKQSKKKKIKTKIIKWIIILALLVTAIALFMMSSVFNIKEIVVLNNSKVSSQEIINLSTLTTGENMFRTTNKTIKNSIKTNAYIEEVVVKRNINGTITLDIKERVPTYMLKFANIYVYINNQGYILETSENPLELPNIIGFSTTNEEIIVGNRINTDDLKKLDDIIKIIEISRNTPLANIITEIDISDSTDYRLTITSQNKTVRIGEMTNINIKLQMAGKIFEAEEGKTGEIYFQDDGKKAIFKENVVR